MELFTFVWLGGIDATRMFMRVEEEAFLSRDTYWWKLILNLMSVVAWDSSSLEAILITFLLVSSFPKIFTRVIHLTHKQAKQLIDA